MEKIFLSEFNMKSISIEEFKKLLVKRKAKLAITINNHPFKIYNNLKLGKQITHPNQVWIIDISYLRTKDLVEL